MVPGTKYFEIRIFVKITERECNNLLSEFDIFIQLRFIIAWTFLFQNFYWNMLIFHILKKLSFGDDCPLLKIFLCPRFFLAKQKTFEVGISKKNELKFPLTDFLKRSFYHLYTTTKPFFPFQRRWIYSKHLRNRPFIPIKSFLSDVTFL